MIIILEFSGELFQVKEKSCFFRFFFSKFSVQTSVKSRSIFVSFYTPFFSFFLNFKYCDLRKKILFFFHEFLCCEVFRYIFLLSPKLFNEIRNNNLAHLNIYSHLNAKEIFVFLLISFKSIIYLISFSFLDFYQTSP